MTLTADTLSPVAAPAPSTRSVADDARTPLVGLDRDGLAQVLREAGVAEKQIRMRVAQLWHWLYLRGATDIDAMANISRDLRARLAEVASISEPEIVDEQISVDGTRKWLFRFPPRGAGRPVEVETGYIP